MEKFCGKPLTLSKLFDNEISSAVLETIHVQINVVLEKQNVCIILIFFFQRDAFTWAHDHRIHHKFSETDSDPHNAKRGFFFAHVGWLFLTPHPDVRLKTESF